MRIATDRLLAAAGRVSRILWAVAACCLVGMVALTTLNIVLRRPPFEAPLTGAHELTAFLGALVISLSLPLNQLRKGNIRVEILQSLIPPRLRALLERTVLLVSGVLCGVIVWRLVVYALVLRDKGEVSMTLAIPYFPFILVLGVCFLMLAVVLVVQSIAPLDPSEGPADEASL